MLITTQTLPTFTAEQFLAMGDRAHGCELIDGHIVEKDVSKESARVTVRFSFTLGAYIEARRCGWLFGSELGYRIFDDAPEMVRKPDISFISIKSLPAEDYEDEGFCTTVPDLVVEVDSPNDITDEVEKKIQRWLAAGVGIVLRVSPPGRYVQRYDRDGSTRTFAFRDTLTIPELLPGFAVPVAEILANPLLEKPAASNLDQ
jgi:Uma2 family endonuclease